MENNFEDKFINEDGSFDEAKFITELEEETEMLAQDNADLVKLNKDVKKLNKNLNELETKIANSRTLKNTSNDILLEEQIMEERKKASELLDSMTQEERLEYIKNKNERVRAFAEKNNISIADLEVKNGDEEN